MKILLLGEYSNVHWTLAKGLKALGHDVTVVSNGDFWKDYPRDISLVRRPGKLGGLAYMTRLYSLLPRLRGYDVVQLINPMFLEIKAERIMPVYRYLRRHNRHVVLGAFGMDYYWVSTCCDKKPLRYSDFNIGDRLRENADALKERADWLGTAKQHLNIYIARDCDAIVTGLYEYQVCYQPQFPDKTTFIPYPIAIESIDSCTEKNSTEKTIVAPSGAERGTMPLRLFIGINKSRSEYKGTDIMLAAAKEVSQRLPGQIDLQIAESVPFATYRRMMTGSDAILDQLYSYTPSMNALEAMSQGIVCIGGGEPENYEILGEQTLRPIVNVEPDKESVCKQLEWLAAHRELIPQLKQQSIDYVAKHHDHLKVAHTYEQLYLSL